MVNVACACIDLCEYILRGLFVFSRVFFFLFGFILKLPDRIEELA